MSTVLSSSQPKTVNHSRVSKLAKSHPENLNWLIIAHPDPLMLDLLQDATLGASSATIETSQCEWDFHQGALADAVSWAAQHKSLQHLVVVGHSAAVPATNVKHPSSTGSSFDSAAHTDRLLEGARQLQQQIADAKAGFAHRVGQLLENEEIKASIENKQTQLHALFYLAHCGTFLCYNPVDDEFVEIQ